MFKSKKVKRQEALSRRQAELTELEENENESGWLDPARYGRNFRDVEAKKLAARQDIENLKRKLSQT